MKHYKNTTSKLFTKISFGVFLLVYFFFSPTVFAQIDGKKNILHNVNIKPKIIDSIRAGKQSESEKAPTKLQDTTHIPADSLAKSTLESKLTHYADDYTLIDNRKKFIKLYNHAHVKYQDIDLQAGVIYVDYKKKEVYAGRIPDSLGKPSQRPVFTQGSTKTENDSIRFNFETKKALVWNTYTKEGEISLLSEVTKKYNDSVMFVKNVKFTTSKDREHPEYYFQARKGKIVPGKKIVIGTTQMWVEDVATPLVIPFGFFPLTETRTSGFLMPSFGDSKYGYSLSDGGFYWAINPYMDLTTTADIYTNGSYNLKLNSRYKKLYRYSGNLTFSYSNQITSERGLPNYSKDVSWNIIWTHQKDNKSSPLSNFSSNVKFGSSKYYRNSYSYADVTNINNRLSNEFGSSITYTKRFAGLPMSMTVSLNHRQNVNTEKIDLSLPQLNLSVNRIYPFARHGKKNNAFQKINFTYKLDASHKISTTDSLLLTSRVWEGNKMGVRHYIPISTDIKILKYFNFQPSIKYTEVWEGQYIDKYWDPDGNDGKGKEEFIERKGFKSFRNISATAGLSTSIYGTYLFGDDKKIQGIRHVMQPSLTYGYTPIFDEFIRSYYNSTYTTYVTYTQFDRGQYGRPNIKESKSIYANLSNSFEAKIRTKDGKSKKIRFLTASASYNFQADSLKLSEISLSSTAQLLKGLNVTMNANFDPYALDTTGRKINKFAITTSHGRIRDFSLSTFPVKAYDWLQGIGRIHNFSISTGYNFDNNTFKKKNNEKNNKKEKEKIPDAYFNNIKWSLNLRYNFRYQHKAYAPGNSFYKEIPTHSITMRGDINFTPSWKMGYDTGYDLVNKGFTPTQLTFYRDLKSWQMSFTWSPSKIYNYWYFNIKIKSPLLQGLKYDKRKEPFKKFF